MANKGSTTMGAAILDREDEYLNEYLVEYEFGLSVPWLRKKRLKGTAGDGDAGPPYYKIDGMISYRRGDVRAYREARKVDRSKNALPAHANITSVG